VCGKQRKFDLEAHVNSAKHKKQTQSCSNTPQVSEFFIKRNSKTEERIIATEGALSFHAVKHHLSYISMDCTSKLNQVIYSDSEIAKKVSCARTKTEAIVNNVLAPHFVAMAIQDLNKISCFGISTDGSNHDSQRLFLVVIQYFHKVHGIK
jgi:hypothetical protein